MNRIKTARLLAGLSQKKLAEMVGISQPHMHDIETGTKNASLNTMMKIAKALNRTVEQLTGGV